MQEIKKIVGINLIILVIYMIVINVTSPASDRGLSILVSSMVFIGVHVGINLLVAIVLFIQKHKNAKYYLLSTLVVGVIGFSACWGSAMI